MSFRSILWQREDGAPKPDSMSDQPDFFVDLNLDQVIAEIVSGKEDYNLKPFFHRSLTDVDEIAYRHEAVRDLEDKPLLEHVKTFALRMREVRENLGTIEKLYYKYQKEAWTLDTAGIYCDAVGQLHAALGSVDIRSRGFLSLRDYVHGYVGTDGFKSLVDEIARVKRDLEGVSYCLLVNGSIDVRRYEGEVDYGAEVQETFEKFKQGDVGAYVFKFQEYFQMNHIEAGVLDFVARLYPEEFAALSGFYDRNRDFLDGVIVRFDREVQFYVSYLDYMAKFKTAGLEFCLPDVSSGSKDIRDDQAFDIALAHKLIEAGMPVVCNDFHLSGPERIIVVSGPNQGGKTTFARTFGQLHFLASLGCPIPGVGARMFLFDRIFTHFEKEETIRDLRGKLQDDLVRIKDILDRATPRSIVIMNEIFNSTTLKDATFLSRRVFATIMRLDLLCVCVTFIDELASLGPQTVSMVSTVMPDNPATRTYKLERKPADGLAHAVAIAEKYRLTYPRLKERLAS